MTSTFPTASSGAWPRPRTRSRAATGTTTGGRSSTRPTRGASSLSGDCCDSFHRYPDDIALVRDLGFGAYRFSIEWSRIEPEDGEFSIAALDYYRRMLAACHEHGVAPVVTFHHFTTPRWMADARRLGLDRRSSTSSPASASDRSRTSATSSRWAARSTSRTSCRCSATSDGALPARPAHDFGLVREGVNEQPLATRTARVRRDQGRARRLPGRPQRLDGRLVGARRRRGRLERARAMHEDYFLEAARGNDFVGVQAYTRTRIGLDGHADGPRARTSRWSSRWATSTGRRRSRRRSATRST